MNTDEPNVANAYLEGFLAEEQEGELYVWLEGSSEDARMPWQRKSLLLCDRLVAGICKLILRG